MAGRRLQVRRHLRTHVATCALIGLLLPMARSLIAGPPVPYIPDEFSYLLAADTFARGRLTNAPPPIPTFFEAPHILVEPTYQSKYPPGGPLVLAASLILTGDTRWGVWLQSAFFGAAMCWVLQVLGFRRWALPVTTFALVGLAPRDVFGYSYFPSMLAGGAAALFFGGLHLLVRRSRASGATACGAGLAILTMVRPLDALAIVVGSAPRVVVWLVRRCRDGQFDRLRVFLPAAVPLILAASFLAAHNAAVTGSWTTLPYSLHHSQYFSRSVVLGTPQTPTRTPPPRVVEHMTALNEPDTHPRTAAEYARRWPRVMGVAFGLPEARAFAWAILVTVGAGLADRRVRALVPGLAVWLISVGIPPWFNAWYGVVVYPVFFAAVAALVDRVARVFAYRHRAFAPGPSLAALVVAGGLQVSAMFAVRGDLIDKVQAAMNRVRPVTAEAQRAVSDHAQIVHSRADLLEQLAARPGSHLVFVRYPTPYDFGDEWVYNDADPASSPWVLVHDLGPSMNRQLISALPGRHLWRVDVSRGSKRLSAYSTE